MGDALVAQRELVRAWWRLKREPPGALVRPVEAAASGGGAPDTDRLVRIATAVGRAASFGLFRPTCLVRAVALERMITDACGESGAVVRIGVLPTGDELLAHAWIELNGEIVGDKPAIVRRFTPLQDFSGLK
ncbi:MAG: lasso peptide biosynthesis B2 protein [Gemmatimonadetes bacterium]|nr:lasso peptide biosynthesis B2 protein [Gemmatimonadota bacterium]